MHSLRSTQEQDGIGVLIDVEGAFDINLAKDLGIDCSKLIIVNPTYPKGDDAYCPLSVDDVGQRTEWFLKEVRNQYGPDKLLTIVWDSLGATNFEEDLAKDTPQQTRGISEKGLGRWIRRVRARVDATNSLWFVINQVYANVSSVPTAEPLKSKGGKAVAFNSKIRIEWFAKKGKAGKILDDRGNEIGARLHFKIDKNRIGPPWGKGFADWYFDSDGKPSLDRYSGLVNYFVSKGLVENGSGCVKIDGKSYKRKNESTDAKKPLYVMQDTVMEKMLAENPELLER